MDTVDMRDASDIFAQNVTRTSFEDIPEQVVEVTKTSILDTLGVGLAASGIVAEVRGVVDLVREAGGKEESSIWGFGGKVPALMAAFANGAMAHALDYDDVFDAYKAHASGPTVPAALAIAERIGGVDGKRFIAAVALGNDMIGRMARSIAWKQDWCLPTVLGVFGAAIACGKLLELDKERLVDALGIAFCQAAGTMEIAYGTGSNIRGLYDSFVGKAGVLSALLAEKGISGVKRSLEGKTGLFNVYFHGEYDRKALLGDMGKRFEGGAISFKPWPCCRFSHPYLTALFALMQEQEVAVQDIERITIEASSASHQLCVPPEARQRPATIPDAMFSIPYILARALVRRSISLQDFSLEAIRDEETLALARRVSSRPNPELDAIVGPLPGKVEVEKKNGTVYTRCEPFSCGHPKNPMSKEDAFRKFVDCASHSANPLTKDRVEAVIRMVSRLETVSDVSQIARLLS